VPRSRAPIAGFCPVIRLPSATAVGTNRRPLTRAHERGEPFIEYFTAPVTSRADAVGHVRQLVEFEVKLRRPVQRRWWKVIGVGAVQERIDAWRIVLWPEPAIKPAPSAHRCALRA